MANLGELLERTLPPMGYELVDWEVAPRGRLVRVFIDKPKGVDVEDCARVSNHLTRLFAVENVDFDRLEVSSPGLDRPLQQGRGFRALRGRGSRAHAARADRRTRRRIKGILRGVEGDAVVVETAQRRARRSRSADIDRARLVPKIEWRKAK